MLYTVNLLEYANINNGRIGIAASEGIFGRHLDYAKWYATWWALRIMDVIDQYDPDFIYTDGNSTQPFSGDKSGSGFKCDAASRVVAHFYNHTLAKRGKVDTFSIIKFHPPCNGIVSTEEGTYPKGRENRPAVDRGKRRGRLVLLARLYLRRRLGHPLPA
jgi:alpha-L-fucosidase